MLKGQVTVSRFTLNANIDQDWNALSFRDKVSNPPIYIICISTLKAILDTPMSAHVFISGH